MIPNLYHFVWYGDTLPFLNRIAISSTLRYCSPCRVVLWHSDVLGADPHFEAVVRMQNVRTQRLGPEALFAQGGWSGVNLPQLLDAYETVHSHVTRSNIARAALLYRYGGVYLDTDVLVVKSLEPLLGCSAFVGTERVVWPEHRADRQGAYGKLLGPMLSSFRRLSGTIPRGELLHLKTWLLFHEAVNGAVLGAEPGHPFLANLLERMAEVPKSEWQTQHRLGTHALQRAVSAYPRNDLTICTPEVFYPLGPVAARQYFRRRRDARRAAQRIIGPSTRAIHWYAAGRDMNQLGWNEILALRERTIIGRLCAPFLDG